LIGFERLSGIEFVEFELYANRVVMLCSIYSSLI